jgi:hypothetical protein
MTILTKELVDELIEICKDYIDSDNPVIGSNEHNIVDALTELSELRKLVGNDLAKPDGDGFSECYLCGGSDWIGHDEKKSDRIDHSPDCIVLRYASYRQEE